MCMKNLFSQVLRALPACFVLGVLSFACISLSTRSGGIEPSFLPMEGKKYEVAGKASGESSSFYLLWMIPVTSPHRLEEALKSAMQEKGADNLIDIRWHLEKQVWILGTVYVIHAEGTAVRLTDDAIEENLPKRNPKKNIIVK